MNAREAMHVLELRTAPQGHPAYRRVCQAMHRLIAEQAGHRGLAEAMRFVDHSAVELERLEAERRTDARRRALSEAGPRRARVSRGDARSGARGSARAARGAACARVGLDEGGQRVEPREGPRPPEATDGHRRREPRAVGEEARTSRAARAPARRRSAGAARRPPRGRRAARDPATRRRSGRRRAAAAAGPSPTVPATRARFSSLAWMRGRSSGFSPSAVTASGQSLSWGNPGRAAGPPGGRQVHGDHVVRDDGAAPRVQRRGRGRLSVAGVAEERHHAAVEGHGARVEDEESALVEEERRAPVPAGRGAAGPRATPGRGSSVISRPWRRRNAPTSGQ